MPATANLTIVGAGVTGLLLILLLAQTDPSRLSKVVLVDPHFDGGALARSWPTVRSNTPWEKTLSAFRQILPSVPLPTWATSLNPEDPTPLCQIARLVLEAVRPHLAHIQLVTGTCSAAEWTNGAWIIQLDTGATIQSRAVVFAHGARPKSLGLPIPSIPLELALDSTRLKTLVQPTQSVLLFGTSHSGTLIIRNLLECNPARITAVHKAPIPFQWARDGAYDGLKLESAMLADQYMRGETPSLSFVQLEDMTKLLSATRTADWVIYAIGFEPFPIRLAVDGQPRRHDAYDGTTGQLTDCPAAWGLGIAYPSRAPDGIHWDVGIASFLEHMNSQLAGFLSYYQS